MLVVKDIQEEFTKLNSSTPEGEMLEIIGASFLTDKDSIFGELNDSYIKAEIEWYESCSRNVNDLFEIYGKEVAIWKQIADKDGNINSNYGWSIWSEDNGFQYEMVKTELSVNPSSRRGTMIYTRPSMHHDAFENGRNDFKCTNAVNYFIRDGKLHSVVQMRSNDVVFGYKNDCAFQKFVLAKLARELGVNQGNIIWNAASLHVYPRDRGLING